MIGTAAAAGWLRSSEFKLLYWMRHGLIASIEISELQKFQRLRYCAQINRRWDYKKDLPCETTQT